VEFGPSLFECPRSILFKLTQRNFVAEYYTQFTVLANRITGVTADALPDCFISGLKLDICREVLSESPHSLLKVVSLATLFEDNHTTTSASPFTNLSVPTIYLLPCLASSLCPANNQTHHLLDYPIFEESPQSKCYAEKKACTILVTTSLHLYTDVPTNTTYSFILQT